MWTIPPWNELEATLRDPSAPIGKRMRAAYFAKTLFVNLQKNDVEDDDNGDDNEDNNNDSNDGVTPQMIIDVLCDQAFVVEHGALLRHEFAYVLGQCQSELACPTLHALLKKDGDDVMVRHEAAEALGAIASPTSRQVLEETRDKYKGILDELSDTCMLALNRVVKKRDDRQNDNDSSKSPIVGCACMLAPYSSVDPAAADPKHVSLSTKELGDILLHGPITDHSLNGSGTDKATSDTTNRDPTNLNERYRAMFSLRDRGGEDAVLELCRALIEDTTSPLLRHEVAFVLGQLQHPASIDALEESLSRRGTDGQEGEHCMVRHESAEALGAIECESGEQWRRIESILTKYQQDDDPAVAESCIVALDAADYFGHSSIDSEPTNEDCDEVVVEYLPPKADDHKGLFGKQKHDALNSSGETNNELRKHILAQHFNVQAAVPEAGQ
jgi:deoxyhypusine monooxygenase